MYLYNDDVVKAFQACANKQRKQEFVDSRMISEDPKAMSNLPTKGFQKRFNLNGVLEDSIFTDYEVSR